MSESVTRIQRGAAGLMVGAVLLLLLPVDLAAGPAGSMMPSTKKTNPTVSQAPGTKVINPTVSQVPSTNVINPTVSQIQPTIKAADAKKIVKKALDAKKKGGDPFLQILLPILGGIALAALLIPLLA